METRVSEDQEGSSWTGMPNVISAMLGLCRVLGVPIPARSLTLRAGLSCENEGLKVGNCQVSVPRDHENPQDLHVAAGGVRYLITPTLFYCMRTRQRHQGQSN